ncbi:MAG TPA: AEC family transporter, partial [Burkholderiaceae bacterium]|nr:AEC family transporter [Burkholderiaceae bacterium]
SVALIIVFNALILWTLVTVSIEWGKHGALSLAGLGKTTVGVLTNPIVAGILLGTLYGATLGRLPPWLDVPLSWLGKAAAPVALLVLGLGLARYRLGDAWRQSLAIALIKTAVQPLLVWLLAVLVGLPRTETLAVILTAAMATGVNVYIMARQFNTQQPVVAGAMLLSTAIAALGTPLLLALAG